jgi:8-oxo-dGTP diphosphatase
VLEATYFDTERGELLDRNVSLRHRTEGPDDEGTWTLKLPEPAGDVRRDALQRTELNVPGPMGPVPGELLDTAFGTRDQEVVPLVRLRTARQRVYLRNADDVLALEVADDHVDVLDGDTVAGSFRAVEAELGPAGDEAVLDAVVDRLLAAGAGAPHPTSKVVQALGFLPSVVRAAGGVPWRKDAGGETEVLVVHRPRYDDWSIPKGKCEPGESDQDCAQREVWEETGLRAALGAELPSVTYTDRKGRRKVVRYWAMTAEVEADLVPATEVDRAEWLSIPEAEERLTYPRDVEVVGALAAQLP